MSLHAENTLLAPLLDKAASQPDAVPFFQETAAGWQPVTHRQFLTDVTALAQALERRGLSKGDRVGILAAPCYECEVADKAILALGAITVGLDCKASAADLGLIIEQAGLRGLVAENAEWLTLIADKHLASVAWLCWYADPPPRLSSLDTFSLAAALRDRRGAAPPLQPQCRPDDIAVILFTSGTTGQPKGIPLRHAQVTPIAPLLKEIFATELAHGQHKTLSWVPLYSGTGRLTSTCNYQLNIAQYFVRDPLTLLAKLKTVQPTVLVVVPRILEKIHEQVQGRLQEQPLWSRSYIRGLLCLRHRLPGPVRRLTDRGLIQKIRRAIWGDRLQYLISGAAPIDAKILRFFDALGVPTCEVYGLSEIGALVSMNRPGKTRYGSVGRPLQGMEVKLAADNEILVRSAFGLQNYWGESAATLYTPDGYLPTGDLGRFDRAGYLYVTGRKKDIIKTSTGQRISPVAIERVFQDIPGVEHFVVVGNSRKYLTALATLDDAFRRSLEATGQDARRYLEGEVAKRNPQLAGNRQVHRVTLLPRPLTVHEGELTAALLKVRRQTLEQKYQAEISRMYADDDRGQTAAAAKDPAHASPGRCPIRAECSD